jgi:transcriptional regulator with XRE-family HTH domain
MVSNKSISNNEIDVLCRWDSAAFAVRLKEVIGDSPVSRFAKKCEIAEGMLRKYLLAISVPGADKLVRIAGVAGVNLNWLATGQGSKCPQESWDYITPSQLAVVLEFERYAQRHPDMAIRMVIQAFVDEYNERGLEIGQIGDIDRISKDGLILWRDLAWERREAKALIDEALMETSIEIADELLETTGKSMEPARKAKLITAIYQLNATTEGGVERSVLVNLLKSLPQ